MTASFDEKLRNALRGNMEHAPQGITPKIMSAIYALSPRKREKPVFFVFVVSVFTALSSLMILFGLKSPLPQGKNRTDWFVKILTEAMGSMLAFIGHLVGSENFPVIFATLVLLGLIINYFLAEEHKLFQKKIRQLR